MGVDKVYNIEDSSGRTTQKIIPPGDYFDSKGGYLGSDNINDKRIYITSKNDNTGLDSKDDYSLFNIPKGFYNKNGKVNRKVGQSTSVEITNLSYERRIEASAGILRYYYAEAGYNINELKSKSITDVSSNIGALAMTRFGGVTPTSEHLNKGEKDISVSYSSLGNVLNNGFDVINLFAHERGCHMSDAINYGAQLYKMDPEYRAYFFQIKHSSWRYVSPKFKKHVFYVGSPYLYPSQVKKYFGDIK